jgi:exodeoxyribonuclease VII small subunit
MSTDKKEMTFEQSMGRLEEIVRLLETNEQPLDETIRLFEEGLHLVKSCDQTLKSFENKVNDLLAKNSEDDNGTL